MRQLFREDSARRIHLRCLRENAVPMLTPSYAAEWAIGAGHAVGTFRIWCTGPRFQPIGEEWKSTALSNQRNWFL